MKELEKVIISFQVDASFKKVLDKFCRRRSLNKSAFIRKAIIEQIRHEDKRLCKKQRDT